jgi:hypothetical protein
MVTRPAKAGRVFFFCIASTLMKNLDKKSNTLEPIRPLCPDCVADCNCGAGRLRFEALLRTDWYGELRYWKCACCKTRFVAYEDGELETAAVQ